MTLDATTVVFGSKKTPANKPLEHILWVDFEIKPCRGVRICCGKVTVDLCVLNTLGVVFSVVGIPDLSVAWAVNRYLKNVDLGNRG